MVADTIQIGKAARGRRAGKLGNAFIDAVHQLLATLDRVVGRHSRIRWIAIALSYAVQLGAVFWVAYELRWDFAPPEDFRSQRWLLIAPIVVCKLFLLDSFGQFRSVLSYFGLADFRAVVLAMITVSGLMLGLWFFAETHAAPPRGVIVMDFVLSVALVCSFRLSLRLARTWSMSGRARAGGWERRVAIIGAGDVGEAVAKDLLQRQGGGLVPVGFFDEDPLLVGRSIHGLPVFGRVERLLQIAPILGVNELVITLTESSPKRVKEIVELGRRIGAATLIIPSFTQLASGEVRVERSRPVAIEDLLGRSPVNLDGDSIARLLRDRVVLVTGAGGSIGRELCRQILAHRPTRLVLVEQAEIALFEIEQELLQHEHGSRVVPLIVDITDQESIRQVFVRNRPEIVFHAAAHKHVPLMERQPGEALKNNTLATVDLMRLAGASGVARFVLISTDKAINPTSVMGCSKRLAEIALQNQQQATANPTAFMAVRFGNVLGSSGSVIPTFRRQIAQGGPVTVTHPEMTRYFMTIPEATGLVLQAATMGTGGEIFILDMGEPVKIIDMARQMIELSGYEPDVDIEIKITGLRPGEKLYEELCHTNELHAPTVHPRIFQLRDSERPASCAWLDELRQIAAQEPPAIRAALKRLVPEYTPYVESGSA
jgi:FlaA1/EpsC-like NDP-sugar epimerase